ncbi:Cys-tRNA(Pro) deacylase [Bacillus kwashiorkori]|uniref:Cys-tRNA(Pro) deacylase n=1 Tax=Bacillus kwashiorkori TaxID=1522318 RepID=UPI0007842818|nr:Cys-tRNA(Pro) deacylase [Bacillus kwashiorkori]
MSVKTNAMRILERQKIDYQVLTYSTVDGKIDGIAVANKINRPIETVYKTLVTHHLQDLYVFIIPVEEELDLKKAARVSGTKKLEMLPMKELQKWTGYIRGGCSPIGMKKLFPTYIDESAETLPLIVISAGKIGYQVEIQPQMLAKVVRAQFADIIRAD